MPNYMSIREFAESGLLDAVNEYLAPRGLKIDTITVDKSFHENLQGVLEAAGMDESNAALAAEILYPFNSMYIDMITVTGEHSGQEPSSQVEESDQTAKPTQ